MALTLNQIREKYPELTGTSDEVLVNFLHQNYYSDIPINEFSKAVGFNPEGEASNLRSYALIPALKGTADIGGAVGYGLEASGIAPEYGRDLQESAQDVNARLTARQSQEARDDAAKTLIDENGNYGGYNLGTFSQQLFESAPGMLAMGAPGGLLARGATAGAKVLGAGKAASTIGSGLGFGAAEGIYSGASNAAQIQEEIRNIAFDKLVDHPAFIEAYHTETDPEASQEQRLEQARDILARKAGDDVFGKTAVTTGALSAVTGGGMFGMLRDGAKGGILSRVGQGFLKEGVLQEAPQSALEQRHSNVAKRDYLDPGQEVNQGVLSTALESLLVGGVMGVGGGVFSRDSSKAIADIGKSESVDEAISAAGNAVSQPIGLPAPNLGIEFDRTAAMPRDTITFSDGSTIDANQYFQQRKAEHGDETRARQETYQALNGKPENAPIGLPELVFTADGQSLSKTGLIKSFTDNGATEKQAQEYIKAITTLPLQERTQDNLLDVYRYIQEQSAQDRERASGLLNRASADQKAAIEQNIAGRIKKGQSIREFLDSRIPGDSLDAERRVAYSTKPGQALQQFLDERTKGTGYVPAESGQLWEKPNIESIEKQAQKNRAFYEAEQASIARKEAELDAMATNPNMTPSELKQYRKARADLEIEKRLRAEFFREGLGYNIVPNQAGAVQNTQLQDQLKGILSRDRNTAANGSDAERIDAITSQSREPEPADSTTPGASAGIAEGIVRANTIPGIGTQQAIDRQFQDGGYNPLSGAWETPNYAEQNIRPATQPERGNDRTPDTGNVGGISGNDNNLPEQQQGQVSSRYGSDNTGPDSLDPILTTKKQAWVKSWLNDHQIKPKSPGYGAKFKEAGEAYEQELNKALANAPFDVFANHPVNAGVPKGDMLKQAHEALRDEFGISDNISNLVNSNIGETNGLQEKGQKATETVRQGAVGGKLAAGEVVLTTSGRETTPFPKFATKTGKINNGHLKNVDLWLMDNAIEEARSRGDDFNLLQFEQNKRKPSQADKDAAEEYLFGEQPEVKPSILKNLVPDNAKEQKPEVKTEVKNTIFTDDAAEKARALLRSKLGQLNSGIDPEIMQAGITLAGYHIEKGARTFSAYAKAMIDDLGDIVKPYLKSWYMGVKYDPRAAGFNGMDSAANVDAFDIKTLDKQNKDASEDKVKIENQTKTEIDFEASKVFAQKLLDGESFKTIVQARKELTSQEIKPGTPESKQADEAIELAGVLAAREIVDKGMTDDATFDALAKLAEQMPSLNVRTSTSVANQAYSTPLPLAWIASVRAGIDKDKTVIEPTAGNGALVIAAGPGNAVVNELNPDRADALRRQGFEVYNQNAVDFDFGTANADIVIANPPFGVVKDDDGNTSTFRINGNYSTNEIDHAISLNALKAMKDDGKSVLIVGGPNKTLSEKGRSDAYNGKAKRSFYYTLYNDYNVTDHFTVSGDLYAKQGAAWPVDVIVIEGRGKSALKLPAADLPRIINTVEELKNELKNNRNGLQQNVETTQSTTYQRAESVNEGNVGNDERVGIAGLDEQGQSESVLPRLEGRIGNTEQRSVGSAGQDGNNGSRQPGRTDKPNNKVSNQYQSPYTPASQSNSVDTLVPVNMKTAIEKALKKVSSETKGDIDQYVANLLDYPKQDISKYFSAEQVDAIALALNNIEHGKGFIIGDQTGVGKGRVNAAMIRYAILNKMVPIFVTEKPNLYGDMIRDLNDIGMTDIKPLATNSGFQIPIDQDAQQWYEESEKAKEDGLTSPPKYGKFITTPNGQKHAESMRKLMDKDGIGDYDVIFTTYNQMQTVKGAMTDRMNFLKNKADGGLLILDESHNAGGTELAARKGGNGVAAVEAGEKGGRAGFVRSLVNGSKGTFYSSATYAKRPDVLDLYSKTDMGMVANPDTLKESMAAGGVPLQQAVASMLAESGQYIRREKSFDGINYDTVSVNVNKGFAEKASQVMREIMRFDQVKMAAIDAIDKDLKSDARKLTVDRSTGGAGATTTNFTSVMHNMIGQMLLMLKTKPAIDEAISALRRGEKPVIALSNTMGSAIDEYVQDAGLNPGDAISLNFGDLLKRYLAKSRRVTEGDAFGKKTTRELTDSELGPAAVKLYKQIRNNIDDFDFASYPVSPIDYIHHELAKSGYKSSEITGRGSVIDYSNESMPVYRKRDSQARTAAGKRKIINDFNNGKIDVIILNQSGATGLSLHASPKVGGDTRKRHMIIAQAENNIDTHMQMLGRINRTGQISLPSYAQLVADIPAEKRPAAILAKKMAMLNANTTAGKDSAVKAKDVPDFMNQYGDEIAAQVMNDNREIHSAIGKPLSENRTGDGFDHDGAMRKVTGRIPVLSLKDQDALYAEIESAYNEYIDMLTKTGQNALEAQAMDLDAKPVSSTEVVAPIGDGSSPFAKGVNAEIVNVKKLGKPYTLEQIKALIAKKGITDGESKRKFISGLEENISNEAGKESERISRMDDSDEKAQKVKRAAEDKLHQSQTRLLHFVRNLSPGSFVTLTSPLGLEYQGIVGGIERKGDAKTFFALGQWKATVYVADPVKQFVMPLSKLSFTEQEGAWSIAKQHGSKEFDDALAEGLSTTREDRTILTGNMLSAYGFDKSGQIVNYTTHDKKVVQGVLMPKRFNLENAIAAKPVIFDSPNMALEYVNGMSDIRLASLRSGNNEVKISFGYGGNGQIYVPASKSKGGQYYLNPRMTGLLGDFYKRGGDMVASFSKDELPELLRIVYPISGNLQPMSKESGKAFLESKGIKYSRSTSEPTANKHTKASLTQAMQKVMDAKFGKDWFNRLLATDKFKIIDRDEAVKLVGDNALFHKVWHGSPHDHNKFDSNKIGTGEGAQVFGYGHYFTDSEDIAKFYRDKLSPKTANINLFGSKKKITVKDFRTIDGINVVKGITKIDEAINSLDSMLAVAKINPEIYSKSDIKYATQDLELLKKINKAGGINRYGKVYEVELAPSQDEYLDWDKPISEQSALVKNAIEKLQSKSASHHIDGDITGKDIYKFAGELQAADEFGEGDKGSSGLLRSLGIRGIRYSAGSLSFGSSTDANNYVIFDDNDIEIVAKYSKDGGAQAFYNPANDTTYFVADNISQDDDLKGLMLHEIGVHALHLGRNDAEFQNILKDLDKLKDRNPKIKAAYARIPDNTKAEHRLEELAAYLVQHSPSLTISKRIVAWFKNALRNIAKYLKGADRLRMMQWANLIDDADVVMMATKALKNAPDALTETNADIKDAALRYSFAAQQDADANEDPNIELNRRIREQHKTVSYRAKQWLKREFSPGGLLPKQVFDLKIDRDSEMNAEELISHNLVANLDRAVKSALGAKYEDLTQSQKDTIDARLKGEEVSLPQSVLDSIDAMRLHIDKLSGRYARALFDDARQLEAEGNDAAAAAKAELLNKIAGNIGKYVNRSYRAFDDKNWAKKVPDDVLNNARRYFTNQFIEKGSSNPTGDAQRVMNDILKTGTAYDTFEQYIKESKLGAKDLSILIKRKEISPEVRALLGEYKDARINFVKSATKMSRLIFNDDFLKQVKSVGLVTPDNQYGFLFSEDDRPSDEHTVKIASDASSPMAPLNGLYTYPEISQAFNDALNRESMEDWYRMIVQANGLIKYGKTVLSPTTAVRNWMSAFFFTMANAHFDMSHMKEATQSFKTYFDKDNGRVDYLNKLIRLGVLYDTPYAGEMMALLADSKFESALMGEGSGKLDKAKASIKDWLDIATKFYRFGDDFWKIIGFENEKQILMQYRNMSEVEAEKEAAKRIRDTYPTYSMTGRAINKLRRFPLVGTFVSFPAEILRTSYNMLKYAQEDMAYSKDLGRRRVAGLAMVSSFAFAAQMLAMSLTGMDDDEEEALRDLAPPWSKNSNIIPLGRDKDGSLIYLDLSFLDPYNYFKRPLNAILRGQPIDETVYEVTRELLTPFFGQDIAFGAIVDVWQNKKESGGRVFNPHDSAPNITFDIANHLRKSLQPGVFNNIERMADATMGYKSQSGRVNTMTEEVAALVGFRASRLNPKVALYYKSYEFQDKLKDASSILNDVARNPNKVSKSELKDAHERARKTRGEAFQDMHELVNSARKSGLSVGQIRRLLKLNHVSAKNINYILLGREPKWVPGKTFLKSSIDKSSDLFGPEITSEFTDRRRMVLSE